MLRVRRLPLALLLMASVCGGSVFAQGRINGTVVGKGLWPLADVRITVSGVAVERTTTTDREGKYSIAEVPPGDYTVQAVTGAFKDGVRSLHVEGAPCLVDFTLEPLFSLHEPIVLSEPPILTVERLFEKADVVALVEILSGDAEHYEHAVYKAKTIAGYKGIRSGQIIRFGPHIGYEVGTNYLLFVTRSPAPAVKPIPKDKDAVRPVEGPFFTVMLEGYGAMQVGYVCVFEGQAGSACGEGISVGWHVTLPETIKLFDGGDAHPGRSWVHSREVQTLLEKLSAHVAK